MDDKKVYLETVSRGIISNILNYKDRFVNPYVPDDVADDLRSLILSEINRYKQIVFDILDSNTLINQLYLEQIEDIHRIVSSWPDGPDE